METGNILKNYLTIFIGINSTNKSPSGLRNGRNNADFIANCCIDKAGFTRTGAPEESDISNMSRKRGSHKKLEIDLRARAEAEGREMNI